MQQFPELNDELHDDQPQQGGEDASKDQPAQRPFFTADHITEALSRTLDGLAGEGQFSLGDALGGLKVLELQIQEQILVQYRFAMGDKLRASAAANAGVPAQ